MPESQSFADFMRRVRAGDQQAATELVRRYETEIRREVRMRLSDPRLYRVFDSMDICQSVLGSFFVRAALGQYELNEPHQLLKLLMAMARHKLAFEVRKQRAGRRDHRRIESSVEVETPAPEASPSQVVAGRELLAEVRSRLSPEERQLADLKAQGHDWAAIAAELGGTAEARRKQLARAIDRVAQQLGLDEGNVDRDA
jgi:RNA polymerase sigma-70 factor (ECF subfamily)